MIEEHATVVAVEGDTVLVQTERRSACQSCSVKSGCGTSVLAKVVGTRSTQLSLDNILQAKLGDEVILGMNENAMVRGSFLVYTLPLLMLLVFALLGEYWAATQNMNTELVSIIAGSLGFIISLFITRYSINQTRLKYQIQPHMVRIVHSVSSRHDTMLAP
ncbi:MAG: SoxR reducing system RseC family protein [Gammaproteobacteria bacterium]|nr:SoxR reducing system RseC family protein [Gammaproteobacteria bacterium]